MIDTKTVVIGALFAVIAAFFQTIPILFSEVFVILTVFSASPIYIVSRLNPRAGILSYFAASMIIMIISTHEGLLFLYTNGIVGASLGVCSYYTKNKAIIWFISSFLLTFTLSIMNFFIGIPVFGTKIPGILIVQLIILFIFSAVYNIIYDYFSNFIFKYIRRLKLY